MAISGEIDVNGASGAARERALCTGVRAPAAARRPRQGRRDAHVLTTLAEVRAAVERDRRHRAAPDLDLYAGSGARPLRPAARSSRSSSTSCSAAASPRCACCCASRRASCATATASSPWAGACPAASRSATSRRSHRSAPRLLHRRRSRHRLSDARRYLGRHRRRQQSADRAPVPAGVRSRSGTPARRARPARRPSRLIRLAAGAHAGGV